MNKPLLGYILIGVVLVGAVFVATRLERYAPQRGLVGNLSAAYIVVGTAEQMLACPPMPTATPNAWESRTATGRPAGCEATFRLATGMWSGPSERPVSLPRPLYLGDIAMVGAAIFLLGVGLVVFGRGRP
jgi:hypothetical protein